MLTVPEAARRIGKNPETVRRWIRSGRLRSRKIGNQHFLEEDDVDDVVRGSDSLPLPKGWETTMNGEPMPDFVALVREIRDTS